MKDKKVVYKMTDDNIIIKRIWNDTEDIRVCLWEECE